MKKLILVLVIFISLGTVMALEYPTKVNNGKRFTTNKEFRGIYERIYEDANHEDLVEICERTLLWSDFWKNGERFYSIKNCRNLKGKHDLTDNFLNLVNKNFFNFNSLKSNFDSRFESERELLRMENNLQRETSLATIFADGISTSNSPENTENNSPFDIVSDLNQIDEIFFGEKSERPLPKYTENPAKKINEEIPVDETDIWLEQTEENLPKTDYPRPLAINHFSGSLLRLGIEVFFENLNTYPLALSKVPRTAFDTSFKNGLPYNSGFSAEIHSIPPKSTDPVESKKLAYNPLGKLNALINNYILGQSTFATDAEQYRSRMNQLGIIISIDEAKKEVIQKKLEVFKRENSRESENTNFIRNSINFDELNETLDLFREKLHIINDEVFPPFFEKPVFPN